MYSNESPNAAAPGRIQFNHQEINLKLQEYALSGIKPKFSNSLVNFFTLAENENSVERLQSQFKMNMTTQPESND